MLSDLKQRLEHLQKERGHIVKVCSCFLFSQPNAIQDPIEISMTSYISV